MRTERENGWPWGKRHLERLVAVFADMPCTNRETAAEDASARAPAGFPTLAHAEGRKNLKTLPIRGLLTQPKKTLPLKTELGKGSLALGIVPV